MSEVLLREVAELAGDTRVSKADAAKALITLLTEYPKDAHVDSLMRARMVALYTYFLPLVKSPETPEDWVALACKPKRQAAQQRPALQWVYSTGSEIVGTDGHRLHSYKTDKYPEGLYQPRGMVRVSVTEKYPDYERVLEGRHGAHAATLMEAAAITGIHRHPKSVVGVLTVYRIMSAPDGHPTEHGVCADYVKQARHPIPDVVAKQVDPSAAMYFEEGGYLAAVMPIWLGKAKTP